MFRFRVQEKLTVSDETSVETKTLLTSLTFTVNYFFDRLFGDDLLFLTNFSIEIFYLFLVYIDNNTLKNANTLVILNLPLYTTSDGRAFEVFGQLIYPYPMVNLFLLLTKYIILIFTLILHWITMNVCPKIVFVLHWKTSGRVVATIKAAKETIWPRIMFCLVTLQQKACRHSLCSPSVQLF